MIGSPPDSPPQTGADVPYPSYFAEQLASKLILGGGTVVATSSDDPDLAVYAVHEADGDVELLVINKNDAGPVTGQFQLSGFQPAALAQAWQYGEAQDNAAEASRAGQSVLANFSTSLELSGSSFSYAFPPYSMTVLDLSSQARREAVRRSPHRPSPRRVLSSVRQLTSRFRPPRPMATDR